MAISTFEGIVENGQIRIPDGIALPEHAKVFVVIPDFEPAPQAHVYSPRLAHRDQAADFAKQIVQVNPDAGL